MRHRIRGRKLGRNGAHRKAMLRNMACSLIRSLRVDEDDPNKPRVPGRVVTTLAKAKELRPFVEKLITMARRATEFEEEAAQYAVDHDRNTPEWKQWRQSNEWNEWNQAIAPAVALKRRAFAMLRDREAVDILFDELAERFEDREGGYTRVIRLASVRLGDAGRQAFIEFVGERDRVRTGKRTAPAVVDEEFVEEAEDLEESASTPGEEEPAAETESPTTATDEAEDQEPDK